MTAAPIKGKSPFFPGQPVPVDLFVGRAAQVNHVLERCAGQVAVGKPVSVFIEGDYGIGKSSFAAFVQQAAEAKYGLHPIYVQLGGGEDLGDVAIAIMQATARSGALNKARSDKVRDWLSKYIGKQSLFGLTFDMTALRADAPALTTHYGLLDFLRNVVDRLSGTGASGVFLVLDEINGITKDPKFAHFLKGVVDSNAMAPTPVPVLFALCGAEERRRDLIRNHPPIDRIFDVVDVPLMTEDEMGDFFAQAFESVKMHLTPDARGLLAFYAAGFPKIMHILGDEAFWVTRDAIIDPDDVHKAVLRAADEVGKKYVDQQVYAALRSADYRAILEKITNDSPFDMSFKKAEVAAKLTDGEKGKLNNFLQRMKRLNVLSRGATPGEYVFNVRMVRLYIWLQAQRKKLRVPPADGA